MTYQEASISNIRQKCYAPEADTIKKEIRHQLTLLSTTPFPCCLRPVSTNELMATSKTIAASLGIAWSLSL